MPEGFFLQSPQKWKLLDVTPPTRLLDDHDATAGRLGTILPRVPISIPVIFNFWNSLSRTWSQAICSSLWLETSCYFLARVTEQRFLIRWHTIPDATARQMFKCQWWLRRGLICTIYCACAMSTSKSEHCSQHANVSTLFYKIPLLICFLLQTDRTAGLSIF